MSSDRLHGDWNEIKGIIKEQWGRLTDDELEQVEGRRDRLIGMIQKAYAITRDEAERQLAQLESRRGLQRL